MMSHPSSTDVMRDRYSAGALRYKKQRRDSVLLDIFGALVFVAALAVAHTLVSL